MSGARPNGCGCSRTTDSGWSAHRSAIICSRSWRRFRCRHGVEPCHGGPSGDRRRSHTCFLRPTRPSGPGQPPTRGTDERRLPDDRSATTELRRVRSADGTSIALERVTEGRRCWSRFRADPTAGARGRPIAALLEGTHSCWLMDRRGKGDSGDTAPYGLERIRGRRGRSELLRWAGRRCRSLHRGCCRTGRRGPRRPDERSCLVLNRLGRPTGAPPTAHADEMRNSSPPASRNALWSAGWRRWGCLRRPSRRCGAALDGPTGMRRARAHLAPGDPGGALLHPDLTPLQRIVAPVLLLDGTVSPAHHRRATLPSPRR